MFKRYTFALAISYQEYQDKYYSGGLLNVIVRSEQGLRVSFPAGRLVPFLNSKGVYGRFQLTVDQHNRFVALERLFEG